MSEFVYLYRQPSRAPGSPQEMQERMQRWTAWFKDLEQKGHLKELGHPLAWSGGAVVTDQKGSLTDGPYAETKDIVIGFSVIEAKDLDEAVRLVKGHPLLSSGGVVEVRPLLKM